MLLKKPLYMKKILIIFILVLGVVTLVGAQDINSGEFSDDATCEKYKFSINFGRAFSYNGIVSFPDLYNYSSNVQPVVPYVNGINQTSNPSTNMVGVEFRWMFKPNWSFNLTGFGILKANPQQDDIMGVYDSELGGWIIPKIGAVPFGAEFDWSAEVGVSRYFDLPNKKLLPYLGFSFLYAHGSDRYELPLVIDDVDFDYDAMLKSTSTDPDVINPIYLRGMQRGEYLTWGFAVPMGAEYFIAEGLFIGMTINVINYFYSLTQIAPGEGMELARADQSTFSFFTRPMLKLGIAF